MAQAAIPPADLLPVSRKANIPYRIVRLVAIPLLHLCFRFQVEGLGNVPRTSNYVVIANHLNWLDEFALLMLFPVQPRLHFLADPTILVTRKFQWWLVRTTGGYVPVVRGRHGDPALFRHVDRCLEIGGDGEAARYAIECGRFDTLQTSVSIADQEALDLTLPLARTRDVGIIAKRPLANAAWRYARKPAEPYYQTYWSRLRALDYPFLRNAPEAGAATALRRNVDNRAG